MNCKGYNLDGYSKIITERVEKKKYQVFSRYFFFTVIFNQYFPSDFYYLAF